MPTSTLSKDPNGQTQSQFGMSNYNTLQNNAALGSTKELPKIDSVAKFFFGIHSFHCIVI